LELNPSKGEALTTLKVRKVMNIKKKYAITETLLGFSKGSFILGIILGTAAVCVAATVPSPERSKINTGRRYL